LPTRFITGTTKLVRGTFLALLVFDNLAALRQRPVLHVRAVLRQFSLVGAITLAAAVLAAGTIIVNGFSENAFRLAGQMCWRFAGIVFFAVLAACPVGRLTGRFMPAARILEDSTPDLIWGFCASYGVYLLAILLPNAIQLSMGALLFVLFGALVSAVMALAARPLRLFRGGAPLIGLRVRRSLLATAMIYFWLSYSLMALEHISGPHRPDAYYGISLLLMLFGLLLRFADRLVGPAKECCDTRAA
jgi:hypothetical protein